MLGSARKTDKAPAAAKGEGSAPETLTEENSVAKDALQENEALPGADSDVLQSHK